MNKLNQLKKWSGVKKDCTPGNYCVSKYIENPLLIGGKKFDLRMYVLVTSFRPLRVYLGDSFARFCHTKYNAANVKDKFSHLTNVSIQKSNENYNNSHGGKWQVKNLKLFLESTKGFEVTKDLFEGINAIIIHSLKAVQDKVMNERHCFELLGYDILIDSNLKPWLIEVNASPSLSATTSRDKQMKVNMINDILEIVCPTSFRSVKSAQGPCKNIGDFVVLYDESVQSNE